MSDREALKETLTARLRGLPPSERRPRPGGAASDLVELMGEVETQVTEDVFRLIYFWLATTTSLDGLNLIAADRYLYRYPGEYLEAFRTRVINAFDIWEKAGTVPGMLEALRQMGYDVQIGTIRNNRANGVFIADMPYGVRLTQASGASVKQGNFSVDLLGETYDFDTLIVTDDYRYYSLPPTRIIEHFHDDRAIWAEFSVVLTPSDPSLNADAWDDGSRWDDDTLWDLTIRQEEIDRVRAVLNEIKPAHARLRGIYLVSQWQQDYWDDQTNWDDGTIWDEGAPITLYLREGVNNGN